MFRPYLANNICCAKKVDLMKNLVYIHNGMETVQFSMQIFIYCKVTLHVSGVTAPIIRNTKNCNCSLRYRS